MLSPASLKSLALLLASTPALCTAQTAAPAFTVSAGNVTMPSNGTTSIPFTLTSVNGFTGTLGIGILAPTEPATVKLPYLEIGGPAIAYPLAANATISSAIGVLSAVPVPIPVRFNLPARPARHTTVWSLASLILLASGFRKRKAAKSLVLALALLLTLIPITACGGPPTLTPGVYTYTFTATQVSPSQPGGPSPSVSTTFTVTVPPGITTN